MNQQEDNDRNANQAPAPKAKRKPYQKPAFYDEQVFETSALNCGKVQTTQGQCAHNRHTS